MPTKPVRIAIYPTDPKDDGSQQTGNQLIQLGGFCEGWEGRELVAGYVDRESSMGGRRGRRDFDGCSPTLLGAGSTSYSSEHWTDGLGT